MTNPTFIGQVPNEIVDAKGVFDYYELPVGSSVLDACGKEMNSTRHIQFRVQFYILLDAQAFVSDSLAGLLASNTQVTISRNLLRHLK